MSFKFEIAPELTDVITDADCGELGRDLYNRISAAVPITKQLYVKIIKEVMQDYYDYWNCRLKTHIKPTWNRDRQCLHLQITFNKAEVTYLSFYIYHT